MHDPHNDPTAADSSADRREFIRGLAALIAATGAGLSQGGGAEARQPAPAQASRVAPTVRDVPGAADDPETIYQVVLKAYDAGANGIVASREYEEMTVPNLRAVGRAVSDRSSVNR